MKKLLLPAVICCSLLLGAALSHYSNAAGTSQIPEGAPSQVLVQEIRALRRAMQDFTIGNSRLQVTIERCRLQQATVERLNDEYNGIQSQIESNEDQIRQMEETAKNLERLHSTEADPLRRGEIEREQKNITASVERYRQQMQQLQGRLAQISGTLQAEKARLAEVRDALDSLDRSFTIQQSERK